MMTKILWWIVLFIPFQEQVTSVSPDGKYQVIVRKQSESDLQVRYITTLTDLTSHKSLEIANCVRRDLSRPNIYWDKNSEYLIFEQCSESFSQSRIEIFNLAKKKVDFELKGLIGNYDKNNSQFDRENGTLIYFDTTVEGKQIPPLYAFELKTRKSWKLIDFDTTFELEFPEIKRLPEKRMSTVTYSDVRSGKTITKEYLYTKGY